MKDHIPLHMQSGSDINDAVQDQRATVFDIQRFSLHDGPGIRTIVFFKGCPLRCIWCQNPESISRKPDIGFFSEKCISCGECIKICPKGAISFENPMRIDRERCDRCGKCVDICHAEALRMIGRKYTVQELIDIVERDLPFYQQSGGGLTCSGGEPTAQFDFLLAFLQAAKERDLNTVIETCGALPWKKFEMLLSYIDIVYYDIKIVDDKEHRRLTGVGNKQIIANARKMVESGQNAVFRVPLIPGMTATETNISDIITLLNKLDQNSVHLLPYHKMGEVKLQRIESTLQPLGLQPLSDEEIEGIRGKFTAAGIMVSVGG
jgi:pyruvate formate lyase activating enzyme